jgi:hypothetical protein
LAELAGEYVAVPLNEGSFRGVVKLNESGAEVFRGLTEGEDRQYMEILATRLSIMDISGEQPS